MDAVQSDSVESDNLSQLIEILQKETEKSHFDPTEILSRLDELMTAVGIFVPTDDMSDEEIEAAQVFYATLSNPIENAKVKAQHYARILASPNPLDEGLIHSLYHAEINALARCRFPSDFKLSRAEPHLATAQQASLTERLCRDLALLRQVTEELRNYNNRMVRPGAPNKQPQQTILPMLAELYVELTHKDIDYFDLPHAENSRFIRFCYLALRPHYPKGTEGGPGSLSKAWKRLKIERKGGA